MRLKKLNENEAPTNTVGSGNIAGSGGLGGEPGVYKGSRERKIKSPVMSGLLKRKTLEDKND